ncbi:MAG TPA: helix-turn-helix domain-containing protein, partial [Gammaproteobacteria bacterium]|nr:helix-turn-helix domain-containing protein [Gammaproteobacteria bacterium]
GGHVDEARAAASSDLQDMTLEAAEYQLIIQALERSQGNVSEAARQLGVTRMALRYRMQKHDIPTDRW